MNRVFIAFIILVSASVGQRLEAAVNVPLTIQEAIYPGSVQGVSRTGDPVTVGIPLPDDATNGATDVSQLTLTGATVGQFRVLGRWPSGRIKWVLVDTLASVNAGGQATGITLTAGGSGNFGGSNLATDNGGTITISTGSATFTIRKANFNGFQQVVVGSTTVVANGSGGFVVTGPAPGSTTCNPCATLYSSVNDANSTAVIEENGPVRAVILATGIHKDSSGNGYMKFTVRMHFYKGQTRVKVVSTLRNADNGTSNSFETAYKGLQAYELRLSPNLSGTSTYQIARDGGAVESGTLAGSDSAYLYQGESLLMKEADWCGYGCVPYTSDSGFVIRKNGSTIASGSNSQYPQGWADIRDGSGAGVSIGVYQLSAYWPKSLEFLNGGSDVRIGIWSSRNSRAVYQAWPQWSTYDLYVNFHAANLPAPASEFLKFQHYLIARAPYTHYNATKVFPYPMVDPSVEQNFYQSTGASGSPAISPDNAWPYLDKGIVDTANWNLPIYRFKDWGAPGGGNQMEFRWSYFMNWITRGMTGRYVDSMHFYRFLTDDVFPHSDGFSWSSQTGLDALGRPNQTSLNNTEAFRAWIDALHTHWYGMPDYYFLTGDELAKSQLLDGVLDYYTTPNTYQNDLGLLSSSRAVGVQMLGAARMAAFLRAIGDTATATTVLNNATNIYNKEVKPQLCPNSDAGPTGCNPNLNYNQYHETATPGVSRLRGIHWAYGLIMNYCGGGDLRLRPYSNFNGAILIQGLLELRDAKGTAWNDYWEALDLAYGISQATLSETWVDNGNGRWDQNGPRPFSLLDQASACPGGAPDDSSYVVTPMQTIWMLFYVQHLVTGDVAWQSKFKIAIQKLMTAGRVYWHENGSYQVSTIIDILNNPGTSRLTNVPITNVVSNGGGSYTISWTVPASTQSYRIKWGPKRIVDWIGFNAGNYTFIGDPVGTMNWFAATNASTVPAPAAAGSTQSVTISTGASGLTAANFSVKAYVGGTGSTPPPPSSTPSLQMVGGNGQSGTIGTRLASPFTVKVVDASGNPMNGVNVAFAVTGGGGSLTATSVATNTSGQASSTLTLGAAPGLNTVTATSATTSSGPITFTAQAVSSSPPPSGGGQTVTITPNQWVNVTPTYQGQTNGGQLTPFTYNNMGVYDPQSKRTISAERWYDPVRKMSIYANSLVAYDPSSNVATVLKVNNWMMGDTTTIPLPENATDPTPIDRHPLGGVALDPNANAVYLVNGANQTGRAYYPDHPNDTWKFSLSSGRWTKVSDAATATHPPSDAGAYAGMVYDPPTGKLAYFVVTPSNGTRTWLFDTTTNQWSLAAQDPSSANVYISIAGIAYDTHRNLVLAFGGGVSSVSPPSTKLWSYSVGQNKWTALPDAPMGGEAAEFAYDSVHDVFLALVGQTTLIYNPRTRVWSRLAATIDRGANLNRQNVTYNPAQDVFVFEGGTWDKPVWSMFRYSDPGSPALTLPSPPSNVRIIRQ